VRLHASKDQMFNWKTTKIYLVIPRIRLPKKLVALHAI